MRLIMLEQLMFWTKLEITFDTIICGLSSAIKDQ